MRSVGSVPTVFLVGVSQRLGTNLAAGVLFRRRSPGAFLVRFCRVACGESCCCSAFSKALPKHLFGWVLPGGSFFLMRSVGNVSRVFLVAVSQCMGANLAAGVLFRRRSSGTCLVWFCWVACGESCCCSAFSKALPKHLFGWVLPGGSFFLMRSVGNVSRVFLVAVSQCMGANLAAALLFRRRSSGTCLVWFCWVACGESCCCSAFSKALPKHLFGWVLPGGSFFLMRSVGNVSRVFFWLRFRSAWARILRFCGCGFAWQGRESCCCSASSKALPKHLFGSVLPDGLQRILLLFGFFEGVPQALFWLGFAGWLAGFRLTGSVREVVSDVP